MTKMTEEGIGPHTRITNSRILDNNALIEIRENIRNHEANQQLMMKLIAPYWLR